jgi:hypothetical protein
MTLLSPTNTLPMHFQQIYELGVKMAGDTSPSYDMSGMLYAKDTEEHGGAWVMLSVPNALVRGVFAGMDAPGIELPPSSEAGGLMAHISVMRPEELDIIGGIDEISERGKRFNYRIGGLTHCVPDGWKEMSDCWFLKVHSPELQQLRRSYGLSSLPKNGEFDFHITVAVRRKGVLSRTDKAKGDQADTA